MGARMQVVKLFQWIACIRSANALQSRDSDYSTSWCAYARLERLLKQQPPQ